MNKRDEHLADLMVKASGLTREEVLAKWFPDGTFQSITGCGFGEHKHETEEPTHQLPVSRV
jgi:hypothetical protein